MRKLLILLTCLCMALALGGTAMANGNPNDSTPKNSVASCAADNKVYNSATDKCDNPQSNTGGSDSGGGTTRVELCHKPGTPAAHVINIDDNGYTAHVNHGDGPASAGCATGTCAEGTTWNSNTEVCDPDPTCAAGQTGTPPNCVDPVIPCDAPQTGNKPNCVDPEPQLCPDGTPQPCNPPKITICHATGSATNPYVLLEISENGLNGHLNENHQGLQDIVPAPAGGCPTGTPPVDTCPVGQTGTPPNCMTPPVTDTPTTDTPVVNTPVTNTPTTDTPTTDTPDTPVTPVENEPEGPFTPGPVTDPVDGPETVVTPTNTVTPRGELPYTGNDDLLLIALLGLALVGAGTYLHRRGRDDDAA